MPQRMSYPFDSRVPQRGGRHRGRARSASPAGATPRALGVGRRALDEPARLARERSDVFGRLADSPTFKKPSPMPRREYRAARALVYETWNSLAGTFGRDPPASSSCALIRLAMRHLHDALLRRHHLRPSRLARRLASAQHAAALLPRRPCGPSICCSPKRSSPMRPRPARHARARRLLDDVRRQGAAPRGRPRIRRRAAGGAAACRDGARSRSGTNSMRRGYL